MNRHPAIDALFPDQETLFYEGRFQDKPFTKQWTRLEREDAKGYQIGLYLEVDPKPLGQGGPIFKERVRLILDRDLRPVSFGSEASGARLGIKFVDGIAHVLMVDGSQLKVEVHDVPFVVEANMSGLDAIMLAALAAREQLAAETKLSLFLVNKLLLVPCTLTKKSPTLYTSSYDEDLVVDERGVLQRTDATKAGVVFVKTSAPPLPSWHAEPNGTRPPDLVRYLPPKDKTFTIRDVSVATRRGEVGGTLTIPQGAGPFPAVVFLSGTGTHDRHGIAGGIDLGTHEILDYLAERGIVGLRFDTRGAGTTKLGDLDSGLDPLIDDGEAWFQYVSNRPEVDARRVSLIGHSQGGTIALLLAGKGRVSPASVALLATPGRPFDAVLLDQIEWQSRALEMSSSQYEKNVAEFRELIAAVKSGKAFEAGAVPDHLVASARSVAWFKDHLDVDPVELLAHVKCRVLVAQGDKDFQVLRRDAELLHAAGVAAKLDIVLATFPDLDHLFKPCAGPSTLELYHEKRHVDPSFLERLSSWLTS